MKLSEIFLKDVTRPIEGVVKADDRDHLGVEVEEYVFTNDAAKDVSPLLEEYTNYTNANGVWISGFFGSGKSHLLKMLAHLLGVTSKVKRFLVRRWVRPSSARPTMRCSKPR